MSEIILIFPSGYIKMEQNSSTNHPTEPQALDYKPAPVASSERISSVDTLRGIALLGILAMNIYAFSMPDEAYFSPLAYGGATGLNFATWLFTHLFFDMKMMSIFSMLFGAGMVLMATRSEESGGSIGKIYFRRVFWLLIIGLIHAYLLWFGDILVPYAVTGFIIFLFRKKSAKNLIILGIIILLFGTALNLGFGALMNYMRDQYEISISSPEAEEAMEDYQRGFAQNWDEIKSEFMPSEIEAQEELDVYRSSYPDIVKYRFNKVFTNHVQGIPFYLIWRIGGLMLLGMGLMKIGLFAATLSRKFYLILMTISYLVGLSFVVNSILFQIGNGFDALYHYFQPFNYVGSVFVALGHISLIMLICKSSILTNLKSRLASVGQMALTNYLMHTILMTSIFYGYGLGLFGKVDRFPVMGFVVGVWILQLLISPIWLRYFRFGPAEWLWRTLTYWKAQPMRNENSNQ
jgi:uncharacterized protein